MKTLLLLSLLCAGAGWASAADETPSAETKSGQGKAAELSARYKVTEKEVTDLRDKKMGWGEIDHALAISQKSGKPLSEIMAMRDSGMGWGKIAQKEGVKLGELKASDRADKGAARSDKADKAAGRADKAASRADKASGRADKADRGHGKGGKH
jgi:hypothetical protein